MLDETSGLGERRATTVVTVLLFVEALWVFLHKYLPMDAGLWALQSELVRNHLFGNPTDTWRLIHYPAANIGAPLFAGLLTSMFSGEVVVRLLLTFGAIFVRGYGILMLFRVLRVRDISIIFLIPVLALSGIWFSGALPYLLAETIAIWVLAFFLSQERPQSYAYWLLSVGLAIVALFHALVFLLTIFVVVLIMTEQRRSVHLSQGWLSSPKAVLSLLLPGIALVILGLVGGEPIFRLSTSNLVPNSSMGRFLFMITPAPDVLEATFKYGDILHGLITILFVVVLIGSFARAYFLAIEEVTWQSRAIRTVGYLLLILAFASGLFAGVGIDTSSWITIAIVFILAGAYSGGPAVRRTPLDRMLFAGSMIILFAALLLNAFSIELGSSAAEDVLKTSRRMIVQEHQNALEDDHQDSIHITMVLDSSLAQNYSSHSVGTLTYSQTAPLYLFGEAGIIHQPAAFQIAGGIVSTRNWGAYSTSPAVARRLGSADKYLDSTERLLAILPKGSVTTPTFGPFDFNLVQDGTVPIDNGEAHYQLAIGKLRSGRPKEMAEVLP